MIAGWRVDRNESAERPNVGAEWVALTSSALCSAAAAVAVALATWRTGGRGGIKASRVRFDRRFVTNTMVWDGGKRAISQFTFAAGRDRKVKRPNLMFSKELLLDAGDLDFFGSSRSSADTENDSDFLVGCGSESSAQ
jgi:hypothetical protein